MLITNDALVCSRCWYSTPTTTEMLFIGEKLDETNQLSGRQVLEEGSVVIIDQVGNVWHNEIAIICGVTQKFYRLEFRGRKTWVPHEWVKEHEPD